jgi:uncharacterized RDD family membrane protein YckC
VRSQDLLPPVEAQCARHPEVRAHTVCSRCGGFACEDCVSSAGVAPLCVSCSPRAQGEPAELGARLGAHLLDHLFVLGPMLTVFFTTGPTRGRVDATNRVIAIGAALFFGMVLLQYVLLALRGQTLGKRLLGIQIVALDGRRATVLQTVVLRSVVTRMIGAVVPLFELADGAAILFGEERRCLHDRIARTKVIKLSE